MLTHIDIRDVAIVERLELELDAGMTVLTGETGAGKSILIDALNLALGDRADAGVIRHGCERAEVTASFDIRSLAAAQAWLQEHDIEVDDTCLLRRSITREGRSKGFINGSAVPMQSLRELGELLVDIHGQHEHQSLLRADMQRQLLDDYAGHGALLNDISMAYQCWNTASRQLQDLNRAAAERSTRLDMLRYQVRELEALNLGETELDELNEEHARLANASKLIEACHVALQNLSENEDASALSLLAHSVRELEQLEQFDKRLAAANELLASASIQIQEGAAELRRYVDNMELDPQRLQWIEQRLGSVYELARKHRITPDELPARLGLLSDELAELDNADIRLGQLQDEIAAAEKDYKQRAAQLSASRAQAACDLEQRVSKAMQQLSMAGGRFAVSLEPVAEQQLSATGMERVEFLVSANPGQPLKALNKVASGGELSRISLAIQVITAQSGRIPTLIFDEVDVGIGGGVAEIVGQQLRSLSQSRQVLCVTHLPQVAAQGHHHIQVSKQTHKDITKVILDTLSETERRDEIARMLGGVKITDQTLAHAEEMLQHAQLKAAKVKKTKI
ncbi:MAG TPA: DNA repair protein RecN [Gammaproteobacteria bacterium]|nr:DNA repair protein RecN [Gammaproteobacteria bacterium]